MPRGIGYGKKVVRKLTGSKRKSVKTGRTVPRLRMPRSKKAKIRY